MSTPSFEERFGLPKKELQVGSIDRATRIRIWNELNKRLWDSLIRVGYTIRDSDTVKMYPLIESYIFCLWSDVIKWEATNIPQRKSQLINQFKFYVLNDKLSWTRFLEFIEKAVVLYLELAEDEENLDEEREACQNYIDSVNRVFIEEACGVRFLGIYLSPIVDEVEVNEIEDALANTDSIVTVKKHLKSALRHLSDRKEPDYNNSIKESISALEALGRLIANKPNATLSQVIEDIEKKTKINAKLKTGMKSLYDWSNDASGVRHANKGDESENFDTAKLALVLCSGIVNYLIVKCDEAGIELKS